jgi:hypothetical protein
MIGVSKNVLSVRDTVILGMKETQSIKDLPGNTLPFRDTFEALVRGRSAPWAEGPQPVLSTYWWEGRVWRFLP